MPIRKYGRFWAVCHETGALVCRYVCRRSAREVVRRLGRKDPGG